MSSANLTPVPDDGDNALGSLLRRSIIHELAGSVVPGDLLQVGLFGSIIVIVAGLFALILPSATSISHSGFYLVLGSTIASVASLMRVVATPALIAGGSLLVLDAYLMLVRTSARWRSVVVVQAALGGAGGLVAIAFLALVFVNLAIWVIIITLALMVVGVMLAAMGDG
jgi:hypothetical protein